jgi:hypothetical protein
MSVAAWPLSCMTPVFSEVCFRSFSAAASAVFSLANSSSKKTRLWAASVIARCDKRSPFRWRGSDRDLPR